MSSADTEQPAAGGVSFADILEEPDAPDPPAAGQDRGAGGATVGTEAGDKPAAAAEADAVPAQPCDGSGEPTGPGAALQPMEVSDGPPGAGGDGGAAAAGGSGGVAPPPGVVSAQAGSSPALQLKPSTAAANGAEAVTAKAAAPTAATPAAATSAATSTAPAPAAASKVAPAAAPKAVPASTPAAKATPAPKTTPAPKAAPAPKKTPTPQPRAIPPDAEPIRAFSGGAAVAGPKPKPAAAPEPEPEPEPVTELDKLWRPVKQNPADFTAWTLLIQYVEAQCFMEDIRGVLKAFLERYPYCYGYWKKYSDLEKKRGTPELCNQVFERGLAAVPLSVDLWLHYLSHMRAAHEAQPELVRAAFERAIAACGQEFRSDRLWEQYASWETVNKEPVRALAVYKRAIAVPTLSYRTHFENLEQFVGETPPQELLTVEEFLEARRAVLAELKASEPPAAVPPASELLPPGCDEPPPGVPAQPAGLSADEEGIKLRAKILAPLRQLHKETEKQVSLRWNYEEGIKRPYFHVKPLEKSQLKNWKAYLDFEIEQGDKERIRVLYERCMIACALYEEYWIKYIRFLESRDPVDPDLVRSVYQRACWTHLPNKPAIHIMWATFEERQGDMERASDVMERLCSHVTLLEVTQRRINLARRCGRLELAEQLYADVLKKTQHRQAAVTLAIKFVRFLYKVRDDRTKALEVLREAIVHDPTNQRLYMQMVDLGFQSRPTDVALVQEAFQLALASSMELRDKVLFAHRRVEFLEEFGDDIHSLQAAQEEYFGLARTAKAEAKKRKQEEEEQQQTAAAAAGATGASGASQTPAAKRAATTAAVNGTEKKARVEPAASTASGTQIPTITETPARPVKTPYRAPPPAAQAAAQFTQPPPAPAYGGYTQPPPAQQQPAAQYQYPGAGYQQPAGAPGWPGYPPQYNYNQYGQYGQGYQYPYQ